MLQPCAKPGCPNLSDQTCCPAHRARKRYDSWSSNRDHAAHKRFARAVKRRDRNRCVRCGSTTDLRAAHLRPIASGGDYHPDNGETLCRECDMRTDPYAR